jgi:PIN domain nuclease of toxin-antitoxin system
MAIKRSLGRLTLAEPFAVLIPQQLRLNGIGVLNIELSHITVVATLPLHQRDPFDRLLLSQCIAVQWPILSADPAFDGYPVERLWWVTLLRLTPVAADAAHSRRAADFRR